MHADRIERAVKERTSQWLPVPKRDVTVYAGEADGYEYIDVFLACSIREAPMENVRRWLRYLDWLTDGRITINASTDREIILHEDQHPL